MCVGGPSASDMPTVPERQAARAPEKSATGGSTDPNVARRRMAFASSILTSAQGTGSSAMTTAGSAMKSVTGV